MGPLSPQRPSCPPPGASPCRAGSCVCCRAGTGTRSPRPRRCTSPGSPLSCSGSCSHCGSLRCWASGLGTAGTPAGTAAGGGGESIVMSLPLCSWHGRQFWTLSSWFRVLMFCSLTDLISLSCSFPSQVYSWSAYGQATSGSMLLIIVPFRHSLCGKTQSSARCTPNRCQINVVIHFFHLFLIARRNMTFKSAAQKPSKTARNEDPARGLLMGGYYRY